MSQEREHFAEISEQFFSAIVAEAPGWVRWLASNSARDITLEGVEQVAQRTAVWVREQLNLLLATDPNEYRTNPLSILRSSTRFLNELLAAAEVAPAQRDPFLLEQFPNDSYNLSPASFADVDESLVSLGITWGAALAYLHLRGHQ